MAELVGYASILQLYYDPVLLFKITFGKQIVGGGREATFCGYG